MDALIFHVISWPTLGCALLVYGFAPGALLRLIVVLYPRGHPRRRELIGELYAYPRIMRPFWVAEQLETALFEGLHGRLAAWRTGRLVSALFYVSDPEGGVVALRLSLAAELHRADVPGDQLWRGISRALSERCHIVHRGDLRSQFAAELELEWAFRELRCDDPVLKQLQRMDCGRWPEDFQKECSWVWLQWLEPYRSAGCIAA